MLDTLPSLSYPHITDKLCLAGWNVSKTGGDKIYFSRGILRLKQSAKSFQVFNRALTIYSGPSIPTWVFLSQSELITDNFEPNDKVSYTNHPILRFNDEVYSRAPIRRCVVLKTTAMEYCKVKVGATTTYIKAHSIFIDHNCKTRYGQN